MEGYIPPSQGATMRDYFAAHAPPMPSWFVPHMPTDRPKAVNPRERDLPDNVEEIRAWDKWRERERWFQWPLCWADQMLARR